LLLLLILLLGGYFRTLSITDWDAGTGQHPDERFFTDVSHTVRLPSNLAEFYDSARSPLNPRSYHQFPFYPYGPLPVIMTRAVAVALTPNEHNGQPVLPLEVRSIAGPPRAGVDPQVPNERRTDFGPLVPNPERAFPKLTPLQWIFNPDGRNLTEYGQIVKVGRSLAALFDLASLVLIYLIGRRLFGVRTGLLAALLAALSVMPIQQSHFFVDPIFSTFFCLLALYWAVRIAEGGSVWNYVGVGLSIGAAMASRITLAMLGLMAIVAAVIAAVRYVQATTASREPRADHRPSSAVRFQHILDRFFTRELPLLVLAGALTLLGFRALSPDSFTGSIASSPVMVGERPLDIDALQGWGFFDIRPDPRFISSITTVASLVSGEVDFPPSQQWVDRPAYIFPWTNMVLWGMGPALGLMAWGAWAAFGFAGLRRLLAQIGIGRIPGSTPPLLHTAWVIFAWVLFYFGWQGNQFAITMRYLLPIYGSLIVFAAWGLWWLWERRAESAERRAENRERRAENRERRAENRERRAESGEQEPGNWGTREPGNQGTREPGNWGTGELGNWRAGEFDTQYSVLSTQYSVLISRLSLIALPLVLILTLGWAYAFSRIYTQPHSRVMAAQWLAANAPAGSYVMSEIWDDPLPLQVTPASWGSTFQGISSAPYAEDEPRKWFGDGNNEGMLDQLDRADYITLTSNRVYDSTSRLPMRYPALMRYYHTLFSGELGFELVAEVTSYPRILGIEIPDYWAEEAFSVYDHPRVLIFAKTPTYSRERAEQLITGDVLWGEVYKSPVLIADRNNTALRITASQWPLYTSGGTWAERFNSASLVNPLAPLVALLVLQLLGLATFALLFPLLRGLPDRGYSLSKILGLLLVAYAAWLLGSWQFAPFAPLTLWLCALPLLGGGALLAYRQREALIAFGQQRRAALLSAELFFLGFFALGLLLRWFNPDLWHPARGGEKPMDFAYLNAVLKSSAFPPYDPWHAGGYINYYYFGFVVVGALIHLTTVVPAIGYNVAVAAIFGLTALGAWGVVYNVLGRFMTADDGRQTAVGGQQTAGDGRQTAGDGRQTAVGGQQTAVGGRQTADDGRQTADDGRQTAVGGRQTAVGGQQTAVSFTERRALIAAALAPIFVLLLGNLSQAIWYLNGYAAEQAPKNRPEWAFWDATRIVPGTVNEFPFFTFLFADLHAHMIVMPISLALLGLGVAWVRGAGNRGTGEPRNHGTREPGADPSTFGSPLSALRFRLSALGSRLSAMLLMALLIGAIRATNTWDYPTYAGLTGAAFALAAWRGTRGIRRADALIGGVRFVLATLVPLAVVLLLGNLLFAPFVSNFATESSGVALLREGFAPTPLAQILAAERTSAWDLFRLYGHWIVLTSLAGLLLLRRSLGGDVALAFGGVLIILAVASFSFGWDAPLLSIPLLTGALVLLWRVRNASPQLLLPIIWGATALALTLLVELVVVQGDVGRMNTVFKFGIHTWTLFALSAAVAVPWLWRGASLKPEPTAPRTVPMRVATPALRTISILLVAAALVYPITATPARLADRWDQRAPRTLDGMAFMAQIGGDRHGPSFTLDEDAAAIVWLQQNVVGTPVIVEAQLPSYQWAGRIATFTGLPTILGWEWHQIQQRNVVNASPVIGFRQQVIAEIYNSPDPYTALNHLLSYGIEYVYVGGMERTNYDPIGIAKFPQMVGLGLLTEVFSQGTTQIYRVNTPGAPQMLTTDLPIVAPSATLVPPLLLSTPVNQLPAVDEYAWNSLFRDSSLLSALLWLLIFYGVALLGMPLALRCFARWHDAGFAWARMIGLLLLAYAVWLPTSLGLWQYDRWGVLGGALLVLALNAWLLWQRGSAGAPVLERISAGVAQIGATLRVHRRAIVTGEAVFLGGFTLMALIRAANPDLWHPIWGGEKPMEFGFLNAILRSPVMPPYDPFFSDGYINYYYYGFFLMSLPIKIGGIAPAVGFNLAVATIFALLLLGAYALARQISGRVRYGLIAAALAGIAGNMAGVLAVGWSRGFDAIRNALNGGLSGVGERLGDWYIGPTRVIAFTINEFPFFTFIFADLHPHMIALPISLLLIALLYSFLAAPRTTKLAGIVFPVARLAMLAGALGALAVTNSWDFPTYGLLTGLTFLGVAWRAAGWRGRGVPWRALFVNGMIAVGVGVASLLLYAPFFDHYYAFVGGIGLVPLSTATTPQEYLTIYALFAAVLLTTISGAALRFFHVDQVRQRAPIMIIGAGALLALLISLFAPNLTLRILLISLLVGVGWMLLQRTLSTPTWYGLLLAWLGIAVSLGVETVFIKDHLAGGDWFRMNTVFKFGMQIWIVFAIAAAVALPRVLRGLGRMGGAPAQGAGLALLIALGLISAVYPLFGTASRIGNRFDVNTGLTLDGLAFMREAQFTYDCAAYGGCAPGLTQPVIDLSGDAAAIAWLNESISGTPIVAQSNLWFYRSYGPRIAANTGLPTILSSLHADEQRDGTTVARRERDVEQLFRSPDIETALRILARYRVNYLYVGAVEHALYPEDGIAKFAAMRGTYLDPVYDTPEVQIYAVRGIPASYALPQPYNFANDVRPPRPNAEAVPAENPGELSLTALEQAVTADPRNASLAFGLADRYRRDGRLADAARVLEPAARANPNDIGLHHLWGDILAEAGRYTEAEAAYLQAARTDGSAGNWNKLGAALLLWGELDKAEIALLQAIGANPSEAEPYYHLAVLFSLRGDSANAAANAQSYLALAPNGRWAAEASMIATETTP
jgi:YYY domain-containing protein